MPISLVCANCGTPFSCRPALYRDPAYCSRACLGLSRRRGLFSDAELRAKLEDNSMPVPFSGCWIWLGAISSTGYGTMYLGSDRDGPKYESPHRVAYRVFREPIPDGLEIDHGCRVPLCWNPDHTETVTHLINVSRQVISVAGRSRLRAAGRQLAALRIANAAARTHCFHGHQLSPDNTYVAPNGRRMCRVCRSAARLLFKTGTQRTPHT
jgi:hypothetical protein